MASSRWIALPLALVLAALAPGQSELERVDGASAPANRWTVRGGSLARTGSTLTPPLRGPVHGAWEVKFDGPIEGEPLVWDDRVLVTVLADAKKGVRELHTLDLVTGERQGAVFKLAASVPPAPSLWGRTIVARVTEDRLTVLHWSERKIGDPWSLGVDGPISEPVIFGSEIYLSSAAGLQRFQRGRRNPVWTVAGDFRGPIALRGGSLFALEFQGFSCALVEIARGSGDRATTIPIGEARFDAGAMRLAAYERSVAISAPQPFRSVTAKLVNGIVLPYPLPKARQFKLQPAADGFQIVPAAWGHGWLGFLDWPKMGRVLALSTDVDARLIVILAHKESHADFTTVVEPTVAGDVAYLGGHAVDLPSGRILWKGEPAAGRAIAARGTVLVVPEPDTLRALRTAAPPTDRPWTEDQAARQPGRAALSDGRVLRGDFALLPEQGSLVEYGRKDKRTLHALDRLLVLEGDDGELLHVAGEDALRRGLEQLIQDDLAATYTKLAKDARKTDDPALLQRLMERALLAGASDSDLTSVLKALEALEKRARPIKDKQVALIRAGTAEALGLPVARTWRTYERLADEAPLGVRLVALELVLDRDPRHEPAGAAVRSLLPPDVRAAEPFDARDWLDFIRAVDESPVRIHEVPERETADLPYAQVRLGKAAHTWREDLLGFESEHLLVLTPLARPGAIARCLSLGELVCETLEAIFPAQGSEPTPSTPLVLNLFESKEEYLRESGERNREAGSGLAWTAGHYDPLANVSRVYLPDDDSSFDDVMRTYAHELTHHWLRVRCPAIPREDMRLAPQADGYWIVEGFACLVEEFLFDPQRRTWDTFDPRSVRLDTVANAKESQLLAWDKVLGLSQVEFHRSKLDAKSTVRLSWYLGRERQLTARHLFYAQAAAAAQYLFHADEGGHREALLDYVVRYYTGRSDAVDFERHFGMSAVDLGRAAAAYAQAVARGERP